MTTVVLIQAQPRYPSSGAVATIRLAGGGTKPYFQFGGGWRSGVANVPRYTAAVGFDQNGLTGGALPQATTVRYFGSDKSLLSALGNLNWIGARVSVSVGDDEDANPNYALQFNGTVASIRTDAGALTLTLGDMSVDLDKPVCPDTFAGTGGLEGGDDATGRVKRRTWGYAFNVEGRVLDKANNVYEFGDPARPLSDFPMVKDKGRAGDTSLVAWQGSAAATLTALRAATPPAGGAAIAPSIACVKWWTVPSGPLTADIKGEVGTGYVETCPAIAAWLVAVYSTGIAVANLGEALGWQSASAGIHVGDNTETAGQLLDRLLLPVSIVWALDGAGNLSFNRLRWDSPVTQLRADTISRDETFKPLRTRRVGFQRNYRQHSDAEISATLITATDVTYVDGTPIETLKPLEAGANRTETRTAAAIAGQGAFATISSAGYGSPLLTGFGALAPLASLSFGSPYLLENAGGSSATLNAFKTILGIASGFTGQSPWATFLALNPNAVAGQVQKIQTDGNIPATAIFKLGIGFLDGFFPAEGGSNITETRTAAGIVGQTAWATLSATTQRIAFIQDDGLVNAKYMQLEGYGVFAPWWPRQQNADNTTINVASGITGQSAFATAPQINSGNVASYFNFSAFQLGYSITRSDGATTVTESLVVTSIGASAAIIGQGALATQNDVGTGQLQANAVTGFNDVGFGTFSLENVETVDLGVHTSGGRMRVEITFGSVQSGSKRTNAELNLTLVNPSTGNNQQGIGRTVSCPPNQGLSPPVYYTTWFTPPAGDWIIRATFSGDASWYISDGELAALEVKR